MLKMVLVMMIVMLMTGSWQPITTNAYGYGVNADSTGRAFTWRDREGKRVLNGERVREDAYGLGVGMDEFGKPVKPGRVW